MVDIPLGLRTAIESGNCVLFLGAGIGQSAHRPDGQPAPDASTLAQDIASHFKLNPPENPDLASVASIVDLRIGRSELEAYLQERLADLEPDESLMWLLSRRWAAIFTTNYDRLIDRTYELIANPSQKPEDFTYSSDITKHDPRFEVPICYIHGTLFGPKRSHIIITDDDYARFQERRRMLFDFLKHEFATSPVLYVGYSNRDPNWKSTIAELAAEFSPAPLPQSYRIAPATDPYEAEILQHRNIASIDLTFQRFYAITAPIIASDSSDSIRYREAAAQVPGDLRTAFEKSPAPTSRLLASWTYVNQAAFHEVSNMESFLKGDRPNWALIGSRQTFERDIEETIYDNMLDYATISSRNSRAIIVLAPAGYGVSTLLMTLAARLVQDNAGPVFMLRPGAQVLEGDIEYAALWSEAKPFFFVDNASEHAEVVRTMLQRLEDIGKPAMFILGERLNEWRQEHGRLNVEEYQIEPLSEPEIHRLLDLLTQYSQLGVLESLSRELQVAAVKQKHGQDLLVVLRETTEGRSFDAILEDEFQGIQTPLAKRLYLTVCCFSQHGAYVRDSLLAELLDVNLVDLYEKTDASTEGVVVYDDVGHAQTVHAARARHRVIASIVWDRCSSPDEKDVILTSALSGLNLNYGLDKSAFDHFVRSDRNIDQIRSLEGRIRFFEAACQKDPTSPYVRQHYARMLMREHKPNLALGQIEQAIKMDSRVMVLYHTQGLVYKDLALSTDSEEIARRWLVQSENSFRKGLKIYSRDEYCYQGLAQLYLGWARRVSSATESAYYVARTEEVISEGLKRVRVRSSLWIESSNIQAYLGDEPSRIAALEQAVREAPGTTIPRYILGRAYRHMGEIPAALEILQPVVKYHPEEFRPIVEYALALAIKNQSYEESIAVLRLSTPYGYSDPRYLATLGGMLFMTGKLSEAKGVFQEALRREFGTSEANEIQFRPVVEDSRMKNGRLRGIVTMLKPGYVFIEALGFDRFLCHSRRYNGLVMAVGMVVTFEPAFSAKGAIAVSPCAESVA